MVQRFSTQIVHALTSHAGAHSDLNSGSSFMPGQVCHDYWIVDDSHEMSGIIFSEKK